MGQRKHQPEEIVAKLRHVDVLAGRHGDDVLAAVEQFPDLGA